MEIDLDHVDLGSGTASLTADVCVIGGGIAGLLLADKLARSGVDVLLLEAGGVHPDAAEPGIPQSVRALGGTSLAWGGQLLPMLDAAGWPVRSPEMARYLPELEGLLGVDALPYQAPAFFEALGKVLPGELKQMPLLTPRISKFAPFPRRNLAKTLGRGLLRHTSARVALHAQALAIEVGSASGRVSGVLLQTRSGRLLRVRANRVVVAGGTVDSCGLLLASEAALAPRLGEAWSLVGRNLHNHLTIRAATFAGRARWKVLRRHQPWIIGGVRGTVHSLKLEAGERLRTRLGIPSGMAHFAFEEPEDSGLGALRDLLRGRQAGARASGTKILRAVPRSLRELLELHRAATEEQRRYVSPRAAVTLRLNTAQHLPTRAQVRLISAQGTTGRPQAVVEWQTSPEDLRGLRAFARAMHEGLSQLGCSELDGAEWNRSLLAPDGPIAELDDARHAMGGAPMGRDAPTSVVDEQLQVHGTKDLYVASAAVFPDGRAQLPTLTLMALTLRLADHLLASQTRRA